MKLTNDLIRDTLLCIEEKCESYTDDSNRFNYKSQMHWKYVYEDEILDSKYDIDEIKYCIVQLKKAGFIDAVIPGRQDKISYVDIDSITYEGHMFLESIRDDDLWNEIKNRLGSATKASISIISKIIIELGSTYIKEKLGLL